MTQHIVEESILLVPKRVVAPTHVPHGGTDVDIVLEKFESCALIHLVVMSQLEGDAHQVEAEHAHPTGCVRLLEHGAVGQWLAPVDHGNVVEAQKTAFEN